MAKDLVETLEERWRPEQFREQYYDDLMKIITAKIKSGKTKTIEEEHASPGSAEDEQGGGYHQAAEAKRRTSAAAGATAQSRLTE